MSSMFEIVYSLVELMTKTLLLVKLSCQFGIRSICIVVQAWIELLRYVLYLHLSIFWKLILSATALFSLPIRAFTALYRERRLEMQLYRMKTEVDDLFWERKEVEGQLSTAIKEHIMLEKMLKELEVVNDEAIVKIELLEGEVQNLKEKMQMLKEVKGKSHWGYRGEIDAKNVYNIKNSDNVGTASKKFGKNDEMDQRKMLKDLREANILARQREVAWSRSLFSAILSLVVGIITWEAEDPCMPLVVALFTVVFVSLVTVVRFYSSMEHNKPASEAVVMLSFNWFILGALTYPALPRVAHALSPVTSIFCSECSSVL